MAWTDGEPARNFRDDPLDDWDLPEYSRRDQCRGDRPHSRKGKCQACWLRRGKPLSRSKRLRSERSPLERERWALTKAAVFERDNWQCQRCGWHGWVAAGDLDCHHRTLVGAGGTSDDDHRYGLANLITLCRTCHDIVHTVLPREAAERLGFVVPRFPGDDPESVPCLTIHGWQYLLSDGAKVGASR